MSDVESDLLKRIVTKFPRGISYAFAYGSAVFQQKDQKVGKMVDIIFVVDNPLEWHKENLKINSSHYSGLKYLGASGITNIQENWACGVYYNSFVAVDNHLIKYGVISTDTLNDDLFNWTHCYVSGRLHKPVHDLKYSTNTRLVKLIRRNRESALRAALLQLPECATKFDLYYAITELSYIGDSRMIMGENPNKVENIVSSNIAMFDDVYIPIIQQLHSCVTVTSDELVYQNIDAETRFKHLMFLPSNLQQHIVRKYKGAVPFIPFKPAEKIDVVMRQLAKDPRVSTYIREGIGHLVSLSSLRQTFTGFLTTGVYGSLKYAFEKVKKAFGSYWST